MKSSGRILMMSPASHAESIQVHLNQYKVMLNLIQGRAESIQGRAESHIGSCWTWFSIRLRLKGRNDYIRGRNDLSAVAMTISVAAMPQLRSVAIYQIGPQWLLQAERGKILYEHACRANNCARTSKAISRRIHHSNDHLHRESCRFHSRYQQQSALMHQY